MKKLIKSISNVITNSSSEVFLIDSGIARDIANTYQTEFIKITEVTEEYLENDGRFDTDAIFEVCELEKHLTDEELQIVHTAGGFYYISQENWSKIYHNHKDLIDEKMIGMAFIDIEDHFENHRDAEEDARCCAVWSEYLH